MNTNDSLPTEEHEATADATETDSSRRNALMRGVAIAAGAGLALAAFSKPSRASAQAANPDVALLNALLAAEWSAIAAYNAGATYLANPTSGDTMAAAAPTVLAVAGHFLSQHQDHAAQLSAVITAAGGTPVAQSSVTFSPPTGFTLSVANILKLAANAEKAAAIVYIGTLKQISAAGASQLVAAIGGVETQHFVILSLIVQGVAAPTAMTQAMASSVVPRSFTASPASGVMGLETLADFTYAPN